jgi:photosystem II stability/assembly factor-like uncharacterized protein
MINLVAAAVVPAAATLLVAAAPQAGASVARPASAPVVLRWLQMLDAVHGYALSGQGPDFYRLLRTDDGGRSWTDVTPGGGKVHPSSPIVVIRPSTTLFSTKLGTGLFAVERSDDGGRSWRRSLPFRDRHGFGIGTPGAVDDRHLYVALDEGAAAGSQAQALYASGDGGRSFHFVSRTVAPTAVKSARPGTLPFSCDKNGFGFATPARGFAGGYCAGGAPFLYRTDDGGHSWRRQPLPGLALCGCDISAPRFSSAREGAFSLNGFTETEHGSGRPLVRVYWTSDGGSHWRGSGPDAGRAVAVSLAGLRMAWIAATAPGRIRGPFDRLYRTSDAGRHWQASRLPFDAGGYQLDAVSATLAYAFRAVNGGSTILRTEDGGRSWQTIHTLAAKT